MLNNKYSKISKKNIELPLISICIPVFNEEENLEALYDRLNNLSVHMQDKCELEFVFTDNHSEDNTWEKLSHLAKKDKRVRALRFSKNFGFQRSILANYTFAKGDALLQIDADLQDPPELLEQFFDLWNQGYKIIYGIRKTRQEGWFITRFRKLGYWVISKLSEYPIPRDAGDFRLIDRKVVEVLKRHKSVRPYLRGMIANMGFLQIGIPYDRSARIAGSSKFNLRQLANLGISGIIDHSVVPLRLATILGISLIFLGIVRTIYYFYLKSWIPHFPEGLASLHILVLLGIGFQSLLLGLMGEYLLRIYIILRREPIVIIEESLNYSEQEVDF